MSLLQTFPPNFEFKRLRKKIKIADISIILKRSQKCVIDKIEVKIKTDYFATNKNLEILAQTPSYFSILIFCPPLAAFPFFD
jgi:uncharacterized membrane protein YgaE (UPF0421/DUF939 family)